MMLKEILDPACVRVPLGSTDKKGAITELVDLLESHGSLLDKKAALDAVLTRENIRSTGIGSGIALPHGKCVGVRELVMAIGIAREPIDFGSIDGKPVSIVILLISPADQTGPHIQALAKISRLMLDAAFRTALVNAPCADELYELLCSKEKRVE
jgi:mannitol/fructose-specific phosphotransferase system IIA component (Ntr-type)